MKGKTILAVDPGTREIGVAVVEDGQLVRYETKTNRTRKTPQEARAGVARIVRHLIIEYDPSVLAIKQPLIVQQSAATLAAVIKEIKGVARKEGLLVREYAPKVLRQRICGAGRTTKRETARCLSVRYPELTRYAARESRSDELYYARLFEAVAVGLVCHQDLAGSLPVKANELLQ
ncbi:MAG: crossover junction endodeoxyribonuclease RuvC [Acidobacteriota bacterium]|nr:crossover junction endodeoxyribonuclease RuvC [Acidobacteriota bacterium]